MIGDGVRTCAKGHTWERTCLVRQCPACKRIYLARFTGALITKRRTTADDRGMGVRLAPLRPRWGGPDPDGLHIGLAILRGWGARSVPTQIG